MELMNQFPTDLQQLVRYHPVDVSKTFVNGGMPQIRNLCNFKIKQR